MTDLFSPCLTNLKSCYFFSKSSPREVCPAHSIIWYCDVVFTPLRLMVTLLNTLPLYQCPTWKVCNVELHTAFKCHPIRAMGNVTIWILYKYKKYFLMKSKTLPGFWDFWVVATKSLRSIYIIVKPGIPHSIHLYMCCFYLITWKLHFIWLS